jgi:hypothetical protein
VITVNDERFSPARYDAKHLVLTATEPLYLPWSTVRTHEFVTHSDVLDGPDCSIEHQDGMAGGMAACWQHDARIVVAIPQVFVHGRFGRLLIIPQNEHSHLPDQNVGSSAIDWFMLFERDLHDLAVIAVRATMLERVEQGFLDVIQIAATAIGRVNIDTDEERSRHRLHAHRREDRDHLPAKATPLTADESSSPDPSQLMINGLRIGEFDFEHNAGLFQGAV